MKALVTGGGGFLGGAIVDRLLARGIEVRSFARGDYPALDAKGVEAIRGDLADREAVRAAAGGCDVVFHVAARPGVWGSHDDFYRPNVIGTLNVIDACRLHGIPKLVYTSTPSVVHAGHDLEGIDESAPQVLVSADGSAVAGAYSERPALNGGFLVLEVPTREEAVSWAARVAKACRCDQELRVFGFDPES